MSPILEGNEVDTTYDAGAGRVVMDVSANGEVLFSNIYEKDVGGYLRVKSITEVRSNILDIAAKMAAKSATEWDDKAVASLKALIGMID